MTTPTPDREALRAELAQLDHVLASYLRLKLPRLLDRKAAIRAQLAALEASASEERPIVWRGSGEDFATDCLRFLEGRELERFTERVAAAEREKREGSIEELATADDLIRYATWLHETCRIHGADKLATALARTREALRALVEAVEHCPDSAGKFWDQEALTRARAVVEEG